VRLHDCNCRHSKSRNCHCLSPRSGQILTLYVHIVSAGDAYWCAVGIPGNANSYDMIRLLGLASEMQSILRRRLLPCFSILDAKIKVRTDTEMQTPVRERVLQADKRMLTDSYLNILQDFQLRARVAIHYGPCFGGVVGSRRIRYHLFGTAVDVAQVP